MVPTKIIKSLVFHKALNSAFFAYEILKSFLTLKLRHKICKERINQSVFPHVPSYDV